MPKVKQREFLELAGAVDDVIKRLEALSLDPVGSTPAGSTVLQSAGGSAS